MQQIELDFNSARRLDKTPQEPQVLSVSDINKLIRENLESKYSLIWLKGEISNFKAHTSGHFYFSLKDSKAQISAVMFRGFNQRLRFRPQDGTEVVVRGKITVYEPRGNYQLFCELMEPVGAGALQMAFEQLKKKLHMEGLFEPSRKRAIPPLPKHVAVVTSPTGAAIRDILNVLHRRFKGLRVTVVPALVQGEQATDSIVQAISLAQKLTDVDVMIVGRGGGSIEDMWAFNTEPVARAIAASRVPIISAVGHEIDFTIADFVADLRAPTPSAAAELVVRSGGELSENLNQLFARLKNLMLQHLKIKAQSVNHMNRQLVDPRRRVLDMVQRLDELKGRLENAVGRWIADGRMHVNVLVGRLGSPKDTLKVKTERLKYVTGRLQLGVQARILAKKNKLGLAAGMMDSLSPLKVVERGYAIVSEATQGQSVVRSLGQLQVGQMVNVKISDGEFTAEVKKI